MKSTMKRTAFALAIAATFGTNAFAADAGVTLYGVADAGVRIVSNQPTPTATALAPANGSQNTMVSGGLSTSRIGFKGVEDLGGGLQTVFQLEGAINMTSGAGDTTLFNRISHVGLTDGRHSVLLGREYNEAYLSLAQVDPLALRMTPFNPNVAVGALNDTTAFGSQTAGQTDIRTNNAIRYDGNYGNFKAGLQYSTGGVAGDAEASTSYGLRASYDFGQVLVSGSATTENSAANARINAGTIGAKFTVNPSLSISGTYAQNTVAGGATDGADRKLYSVGAYYTPNAYSYGVAYYNTQSNKIGGVSGANGTQDKLLALASVNLSKRTALYGAIDYTLNHDAMISATSGSDNATGLTVGINHSF